MTCWCVFLQGVESRRNQAAAVSEKQQRWAAAAAAAAATATALPFNTTPRTRGHYERDVCVRVCVCVLCRTVTKTQVTHLGNHFNTFWCSGRVWRDVPHMNSNSFLSALLNGWCDSNFTGNKGGRKHCHTNMGFRFLIHYRNLYNNTTQFSCICS